MRFIDLKEMAQLPSLNFPSILCVGNFDGVHLGHRQLVNAVFESYDALKDEHPNLVCGAWFFDSTSYKLANEIYSLEEKLSVFADLGLDYAIIADFDEMKSLSPEAFVNDVLRGECKCIHAVCGENFRFGSRATGDSSTMKKLMNGSATVVPLLSIDCSSDGQSSIVISSTYIRSLLSTGEIEKANELLGKRYSLCEVVVHGKKLGRTIGIPTINQRATSKKFILKNGIYATVCTIDGNQYYGVTNVGIRPTVEDNGEKNIETFIIDFEGDCYGKSVKLEFVARIRDEMKFDGIDKLQGQIQKDIIKTKEIFNS